VGQEVRVNLEDGNGTNLVIYVGRGRSVKRAKRRMRHFFDEREGIILF
jgi:hypothetical protein